MADDVRVVGAFLRLEEHRNVPPRRDIEAALAGWCIAVDRAVPDGDGVPIVAIVRRKSVHALKNLKEGSSSSCRSNRRRTKITRTKKERNPTPPPPSRYSYSLLVSSSSSSSSSVESKRTAVYSSPIERVVISKGPRTHTHVRRL